MKNIYNLDGKKLGISKEIFIDFYKSKVLGLEINNLGVRNNYVDIEDILMVNEEILARKLIKGKGLKFSDIKSMEVIDKLGKSKGVVEDLLINEETFEIKGLILNSGIIDTFTKGKEVVLIKNCVLGENYILYFGEPNVILKNITHEMSKYERFRKA